MENFYVINKAGKILLSKNSIYILYIYIYIYLLLLKKIIITIIIIIYQFHIIYNIS